MSAPRSTGEIKAVPGSRAPGRRRGGRAAGTLAFLVAGALSACSSIHDDRPAVDLRGKDERTYRADLSECQDIAAGTGDKSDIARTAAIGTALGAATGAAAGAIGGSAGTGAAAGALAGLVFGGGYEAVTTERTEKRALRNCLYKRGYTVLD